MTYYGDVNLTGGWLQNLSSVKHAKFSYYKTSRKTETILPLTFDALSVKSDRNWIDQICSLRTIIVPLFWDMVAVAQFLELYKDWKWNWF